MAEKRAKTEPDKILGSSSFHVLARCILFESLSGEISRDFGREMYDSVFHALRPTGPFGENGVKKSMLDYEYRALELLLSMSSNGFDPSKPVQLSSQGIVDGAHRVAAAIVVGESIYFENSSAEPFGVNFKKLEKLGLQTHLLEALSEKFLMLKSSTRYLLFFGFSGDDFKAQLRKLELNNVSPIYTWFGDVSKKGAMNVLNLAYGHNSWFTSDQVESLYYERYLSRDQTLGVVFFDQDEMSSQKLKSFLRSDHSGFERTIHGSDDYWDTVRMAPIIKAGGRDLLMNYVVDLDNSYIRKIRPYSDETVLENIGNRATISGSTVLQIHGLREAADLDLLLGPKFIKKAIKSKFDNHNDFFQRMGESPIQWSGNPSKYFYLEGHKILSLRSVLQIKIRNGSAKDFADINLLAGRNLSWQSKSISPGPKRVRAITLILRIRASRSYEKVLSQLPTNIQSHIRKALRTLFRRKHE